MTQAFLFDLDGTLIDSAPDLHLTVNLVLGHVGSPPITLEQTRRFVGNGARELLRRALAASGADPDLLDACHARFLDVYLAHCCERTALYPGALQALDALDAPLGLTTNKPLRHTRRILDALGLADRFRVVLGGDSVPVKKPDPAMLFEALGALGATPERSWLVGDSAVDAAAARRGGLRLCLVSWGYCEPDVRRLGADVVIDDLRELPAALTVPPPARGAAKP